MTPRARRSWICALALSLCALHAWMAGSVSRTFSTTFDEIAHLTAGYAYWTQADYRLQPENGNLPQRLAALPLLAQDIAFPPATGEDWRAANVWRIGHAFFHNLGNDLPSLLAAGRAMNALLSGVLCFFIFLWARLLFGLRAGLLALVLAVFCPALLANGGLITSDTAAALGFTVASFAWWRLLHRVTISRVVAAGFGAGLLAISKYSVVLFAPMALLLVIIRLTRPAPLVLVFKDQRVRLTGWKRLPAFAGIAVAAAVICVAVIWSAYGFRYSAAPAGHEDGTTFSKPWDDVLLKGMTAPPANAGPDTMDLRPGPVQHFAEWARDHRLLPEAWLYGLAFVEGHTRGRMAYFSGEYRLTGWREFFPTVFLLKTTLPALALIALGFAGLASATTRRRRAWLYQAAPLLVMLAVYWAFSIQSKLNIGHRHLLPTYAAFYILTGAGVLLVRRHKAWALPLVLLLAWHGRESISIRPDYLAYFNPLAGGPERAHRLFVDSSLDWGQDLPRLHAWLKKNRGDQKVFLSYFGTGSPKQAGITATRIADGYFDSEPRPTVPNLEGGLYCISATMLSRVYSPVRGPWTSTHEAAYRQLHAWLGHLRTQAADTAPTWLDGSPLEPAAASARLKHYEQLLFSRLCHFLQLRQPDARIGYSILVFRLRDEEALAVANAPLPALNARLLEMQSRRKPGD